MPFSFSFESPTGIYFGAGESERLADLPAPYGRRVLVLTGRSWLSSSGWQDRLKKILQKYTVRFFACASGEPSVESIEEAREGVSDFDPEVLVAVGGGSVLDTAKALSALISLKESPLEYLEGVGKGRRLEEPGIPWIAVPTTSGTGAEVTKNSVIRAKEKGAKKSLRSPYLIAAYAVVDPELTLDLPLRITGISGMDALTQLIESYVSRKAQPMVGALVRDALPGMLTALKKLSEDLQDLDARTDAAYGSMISGIALANAGLGAAHGFASGIGGLFDIPHGLICAVCLPYVVERNATEIEAPIGRLLREAGLYTGGDPLGWLVAEIRALFEPYGLEKDLRSFGIGRDRIEEIAERSSGSSMSGNPVPLSLQDKVAILQSIL